MASGLSTQGHKAVEHRFWGDLAVKLIHPTQLLILEAIWWIEEPLSATLLQGVYGDRIGLSLFSYHLRRLEALEVLEQVGEVPVRGVSEKLFDLAAGSRAERA